MSAQRFHFLQLSKPERARGTCPSCERQERGAGSQRRGLATLVIWQPAAQVPVAGHSPGLWHPQECLGRAHTQGKG